MRVYSPASACASTSPLNGYSTLDGPGDGADVGAALTVFPGPGVQPRRRPSSLPPFARAPP